MIGPLPLPVALCLPDALPPLPGALLLPDVLNLLLRPIPVRPLLPVLSLLLDNILSLPPAFPCPS